MALNERDMGGADGNAERDPRLERLYREAAREGPPAQLDAAILAAARREVGGRPRSLSSALRRWHVPVSIAAVVVVTVSLVILVKEEGGERIGEVSDPPVAAPADQPAAAPTQAPRAAAAQDSTQLQMETPATAGQRRLPEVASRPLPVGKSAVPAPLDTGPPAVSGVAAGATPEPAAEPLPKPFLAERSRKAQERAAAPASPGTVTAGRPEGAPSAPMELRSSAPAADTPQARSMARAIAAKPAASDRPPVWDGLEKEPPEKWLARIEELLQQGRTAEAEDMRSEFKRRFPDHPLNPASK
jgi:hypothetical protein